MVACLPHPGEDATGDLKAKLVFDSDLFDLDAMTAMTSHLLCLLESALEVWIYWGGRLGCEGGEEGWAGCDGDDEPPALFAGLGTRGGDMLADINW